MYVLFIYVLCFRCQVSGVWYQVTGVKCRVPGEKNQMSITLTATAADPLSAKFPNMHTRLCCEDKKKNHLFFCGPFLAISLATITMSDITLLTLLICKKNSV